MLGREKSIVLNVKSIKNLKSLKYLIFVVKICFFLVFATCVEAKMNKIINEKESIETLNFFGLVENI